MAALAGTGMRQLEPRGPLLRRTAGKACAYACALDCLLIARPLGHDDDHGDLWQRMISSALHPGSVNKELAKP